MRKRLRILILCAVLLAGIGTAAAAAGGAEDPLLSLSYLYNTCLPKLQSLFSGETEAKLGAAAESYAGRLDAIRLPGNDEWERASSYVPLTLEDGGSVRLGPFGKFLLTGGQAKLTVVSGEVIDVSEGRVCADGEWLALNHRYFAAEESEALIRSYADGSEAFVDGRYRTEITGSIPVAERFTDIDGHWARGRILELAEKGLVNGMEAHRFEPDRKVTRAMFVTIMGRMYGVDSTFPAPEGFSDVKASDWFAPYVGWAAAGGVVNGYDDGTFAPNREITREQMALILIRYCDAVQLSLPETESGSAFLDEGEISAWALEAVLRARSYGLINGRENGCYDPKGTATRAEMCAVIARLMEKAEAAAAAETPEEDDDE